jgi:hypothetical protein
MFDPKSRASAIWSLGPDEVLAIYRTGIGLVVLEPFPVMVRDVVFGMVIGFVNDQTKQIWLFARSPIWVLRTEPWKIKRVFSLLLGCKRNAHTGFLCYHGKKLESRHHTFQYRMHFWTYGICLAFSSDILDSMIRYAYIY